MRDPGAPWGPVEQFEDYCTVIRNDKEEEEEDEVKEDKEAAAEAASSKHIQ